MQQRDMFLSFYLVRWAKSGVNEHWTKWTTLQSSIFAPEPGTISSGFRCVNDHGHRVIHTCSQGHDRGLRRGSMVSVLFSLPPGADPLWATPVFFLWKRFINEKVSSGVKCRPVNCGRTPAVTSMKRKLNDQLFTAGTSKGEPDHIFTQRSSKPSE